MLGELDAADRVVVADLEAGLGTLSRAEAGLADLLLIVVEPNPRSLEVGRRAVRLARERGLPRLQIVANRVRDAADLARVREALPGEVVFAVPDDPAILDADRRGAAPLGTAPEASAVRALGELADRLLERGN